MVEGELHDSRPSRDERFARLVDARVAVEAGRVQQVRGADRLDWQPQHADAAAGEFGGGGSHRRQPATRDAETARLPARAGGNPGAVGWADPKQGVGHDRRREAEAEAEEEDRDPWRDSPYQSPSNSFNAGRRMRAMHHDARMHAPTAMTSSQVSACASPTPPASLTVSFAQNNGNKY